MLATLELSWQADNLPLDWACGPVLGIRLSTTKGCPNRVISHLSLYPYGGLFLTIVISPVCQAQLLQPDKSAMAAALLVGEAAQTGADAVNGALRMLDSLNRGVRERTPG